MEKKKERKLKTIKKKYHFEIIFCIRNFYCEINFSKQIEKNFFFLFTSNKKLTFYLNEIFFFSFFNHRKFSIL